MPPTGIGSPEGSTAAGGGSPGAASFEERAKGAVGDPDVLPVVSPELFVAPGILERFEAPRRRQCAAGGTRPGRRRGPRCLRRPRCPCLERHEWCEDR